MSSDNLQFTNLQGESLIKTPGEINGESFTIRDLKDCSVYLLDYTSEVEVTNCTNCQIFVGPVDGPAIFDSCSNCQVAVACQQFQAKACQGCEFGLYCATVPSITNCTAISVSCWAGAYPGLSAHFASANLDPSKNQWNKVYDASSIPGQSPNFELLSTVHAWEAPLVDGLSGEPENPVPPTTTAAPLAAFAHDAFHHENSAGSAVQNGDFHATTGIAQQQTAAEAAAGYDVDMPTTADARNKLQQRLAAQAKEETEKKSKLQQTAAQYLTSFYEERNATRDKRIASGRDELQRRGSAEVGPEGATVWERAISMIDFNMSRPSGSDLTRFKSVLFSCKERIGNGRAM